MYTYSSSPSNLQFRNLPGPTYESMSTMVINVSERLTVVFLNKTYNCHKMQDRFDSTKEAMCSNVM